MNIRDRILIAACKNSWRAYNFINTAIAVGDLRIPLGCRTGLGNIKFVNAQFQVVLRAALASQSDGYIVDVGANVGKFLLNLIAIDRNVPYIGFEPLISGAMYIRRVIIENRLEHHSIVPVGLGEQRGTATIRFGEESDASATLSDSVRPPSMYSQHQLVAVSTADDQLQHIPAISFVKIDVEGTEISVLRGMTDTINKTRPPLLLEVMPYAHLLAGTYNRRYFGELSANEAKRVATARREHSLELESFLRHRNYVFYSCSRDGKIDAASSLDRSSSQEFETDFLALPSEKALKFVDSLRRASA